MYSSTYDLVCDILLRPRMFSRAENLHDLLMFIDGVCCGRRPPHGAGALGSLPEYVNARFNATPTADCMLALERAFGHLPLLDASRAVHAVLCDWPSKPKSPQG